ncbi:SHOCT domain-containing protein [Thermomonas fusca]|uniref:SHOCT domain-containing protein n=1 Tax=Thermomonas fusca TaxID=215690 RepID=UPI00056DFFB5|nr:SHOCT domain-containing protein [Thermomonas fusca]
MKRIVLSVALLALGTPVQAGKPEVVQLSPDTYMIIKADHGGIFGGGIPKLKIAVIKQANEFAAAQGKIAIPLASNEKPMGGGPAQWATFEYQFRVVAKDDPEAQRTSLTPRADTVVQIESAAPKGAGVPTASPPAAGDDVYDKLLKLDELRKRGILTETEFQTQKRKLLGE